MNKISPLTHLNYECRLDPNIRIHQSSVLSKRFESSYPSDWIVFSEITGIGGSNVIKDCAHINTVTLAVFGGSLHVKPVLEGIN